LISIRLPGALAGVGVPRRLGVLKRREILRAITQFLSPIIPLWQLWFGQNRFLVRPENLTAFRKEDKQLGFLGGMCCFKAVVVKSWARFDDFVNEINKLTPMPFFCGSWVWSYCIVA
jgi:hypothetical protein